MRGLTFDANRPIDLICMGRVAVDLYAEQIHSPLAQAQTMRKYLGGCAGNIAVGTARLGLKTMMFSCVGKDEMGTFLRQTLQSEGVRTDLLYESENHLTGLVLLGIDPPNHFPLMFYRKDCADMQLKPEHVHAGFFAQAKAILFTGTGLSTAEMRTATSKALATAKETGTKILMDLDYRPVLWGLTSSGNGETRYINSDRVSTIYQEYIRYCDLIIGTEEEICIAGGSENLSHAIQSIRLHSQAPIVIKNGARGCTVLFNDQTALNSAPFSVEILNVLGAGDAFMSGLLRGLLQNESWESATTYANACGAIVVTRHGCAPAIPFWEELNYFLEQYPNNADVWRSDEFALMHTQLTLRQQVKSIYTFEIYTEENIGSHAYAYINFNLNKHDYYHALLRQPSSYGVHVKVEAEAINLEALSQLSRSCQLLERRLLIEIAAANFISFSQCVHAIYSANIFPFAWFAANHVIPEQINLLDHLFASYDVNTSFLLEASSPRECVSRFFKGYVVSEYTLQEVVA